MTHQLIRRFQIAGECDDAALARVGQEYESILLEQMRNEGFVPVLDLDPVFFVVNRTGTNLFEIQLTIQAVNVGMEESWKIEGILSGRKIPKYMPKNKSKQ